MQENIANLYTYQCFIDGKPVFERVSTHWSDALCRALNWKMYCIRPYNKIEILNIWTGKRYSLDECIKRSQIYRNSQIKK